MQPTSGACSRSIDRAQTGSVNTLTSWSLPLKIALLFLSIAVAFSVDAQTYSVSPETSNVSKGEAGSAQSTDQSLGWGSNIQNARLARAAQLALQQGNHTLALDYAQRAALAAPNDPQLWFLLGYAARLCGKYLLSADAYSRGLRLNPSSVDGLSGMAQTYNEMGRTDDAERLLKEVLAADPRRNDDAVLLGDLYMRSADFASALEWLGRAERSQPSVRAELLIAICYGHLKQMDLASQYLDLAKRHAPDNPDVQRAMAGYYRETGNYAEAIAALRLIRKPKPDVVAELAYTLQLNGQLLDSAKTYEQAAIAAPKDLDLQLSAAQAEVAVGSIDKANSLLDRSAGIDANHYRLHAIRGEIARMQEREADAAREYSSAIANLPDHPVEGALFGIQLHVDLMGIYRNQGDDHAADRQLGLAQSQINMLSDQGAGRAQVLRLRALIKLNSGNGEGALTDIGQALEANPHDSNNLQLDGDILIKLGRIEDAIAAYRKILAIDSNNQFALTSLGYASRAAGNDLEAEKYFQRLAKSYPSLYIPHLALGDLYTARRDFSRAEASYAEGYALAPQKALIVAGGMNAAIEAHDLNLAGTWLSRTSSGMEKEPQILREKERYLSFRGNYQASAEIGMEAIKMLPRDRDVVVYLGYDLLQLGKFEDLLALTSKNLDTFPREPAIPLLQGYVHKHQGLSELARKDFTEALSRDPEVVTAYVNRGYMLNDLGLALEASNDFEAALKREPDNGEAHLGLAYASLGLRRPQAALREAELAERWLGDSRDIHVIRATAYGRQSMFIKAAVEYRAALKFTPDDGALHLGLGNTFFAQRQYHDAIDELEIAAKDSPENGVVYALLARTYANLQDREQTMRYVQLAELHSQPVTAAAIRSDSTRGDILVSIGVALGAIGDQAAAMECFRKALAELNSDRVSVRLAIAQLMADQGHPEDAERQIALAQMEGDAGETLPPSGGQFIATADVFRSMHEYEISQLYLQRAKAAGAPDLEVRIGLANNYLALGETAKAQAELFAIRNSSDDAPNYQYLLAQANLFRQQHHDAQALTSFAQASTAAGEDQKAEQDLLQAGADEGLRITPALSLLSDFSVEPIFEDSTVYILDSKLDATFPVSSSDIALLPPPRSSLSTQLTNAFHLHLGHLPTTSGFFQVRDTRGQISVPGTNSIVSRATTDYSLNVGLNPTINVGNNVLTFNSGVQATVRRDSKSPVEMNQNLIRVFTYVSTSSFFNAVSVSGYIIHESGPFTESNLHSRALTGAIDFRVGAPWGKTTMVVGWGSNDQQISPVHFENYLTSSYIGIERRFGERLTVKAIAEDLRSWRVVRTQSGLAQNLRPAGTVDFAPNRKWNLHLSTAYSSARGFHAYDAVQNAVSISYARPFHRKFRDDSGTVVLQYPIRFTAGLQEETFFNFTGGNNQQFRPYVRVSLF